jgi:hypothetical protein
VGSPPRGGARSERADQAVRRRPNYAVPSGPRSEIRRCRAYGCVGVLSQAQVGSCRGRFASCRPSAGLSYATCRRWSTRASGRRRDRPTRVWAGGVVEHGTLLHPALEYSWAAYPRIAGGCVKRASDPCSRASGSRQTRPPSMSAQRGGSSRVGSSRARGGQRPQHAERSRNAAEPGPGSRQNEPSHSARSLAGQLLGHNAAERDPEDVDRAGAMPPAASERARVSAGSSSAARRRPTT